MQLNESLTAATTTPTAGHFNHLQMAPADPILGVAIAYKNDTDPRKVDLGIGAYRTNEGKPYVFKVVTKAEQAVISDPTSNKEYLPIDGHPGFVQSA